MADTAEKSSLPSSTKVNTHGVTTMVARFAGGMFASMTTAVGGMVLLTVRSLQ
jgi:hypothetical protein